jgi:hypothetical protein
MFEISILYWNSKNLRVAADFHFALKIVDSGTLSAECLLMSGRNDRPKVWERFSVLTRLHKPLVVPFCGGCTVITNENQLLYSPFEVRNVDLIAL